VGQIIQARVEQINKSGSLIVSIDGNHYAVANLSSENFVKDQTVFLYVESSDPVRLKISRKKEAGHIDFNV
jgi:hypothetical protein